MDLMYMRVQPVSWAEYGIMVEWVGEQGQK